MGKLINALLYGGLKKEEYKLVREEIEKYNVRTMLEMLGLSAVAMITLFIMSCFPAMQINANRLTYGVMTAVVITLVAMTFFLAKRSRIVLEFMKCAFLMMFFAFGIVLAVNGANDISATYMVFLFAIPMLLIIRPIIVIGTIVLSDIVYILLMLNIQPHDIYLKNMTNAIFFGALSCIISSFMIQMKVSKYWADYLNYKLMYNDMLTDFLNRNAYNGLAKKYGDEPLEDNFVYVMIDVNGLKYVNDTLGHQAGDKLLVAASQCIQNAFGEYGKLFRMGGDEFVAILNIRREELDAALDVLKAEIKKMNTRLEFVLSMAVGCATPDDFGETPEFEQMAKIADEKMYEDKKRYYEESGIDRRRR